MLIDLFHQGGGFMWPILAALVIGLMVVLERFFTLTKASVNTKKLLQNVHQALEEEGVPQALEVCENTPGPVAEIFHAGLSRVDRGIEEVEKAVQNAGSIEMSFLERGLTWLATIIAIAPMLGFTGTVWGMILAFQDIEKANDISPSIVAGGISVALLTTLFGLIVAIIIQFFHNFFVTRIDKIIIDMEEGSLKLIDTLTELEEKGELKKS
ncbi:MAG: MotA/TolQ/ExbB proton channel family protein [Candidatus Marinimicrobia bacterium]|nr:MotA/TolQ/ExbB proton channel family protein [Candidatus Neomarinimicrobiota bacterium]MCF7827994.1 MotA/TolQ/ExbB proton channel family protein [Candidatus Neomarinimicrobiota bacterium]MCF7879251.1 MotA/TolQ/ExbB proton channel family protein [Candidatus Neomarinimicrobiota bacterium]